MPELGWIDEFTHLISMPFSPFHIWWQMKKATISPDDYFTNRAIKMMMGMGIPRKYKSIERIACLLL